MVSPPRAPARSSCRYQRFAAVSSAKTTLINHDAAVSSGKPWLNLPAQPPSKSSDHDSLKRGPFNKPEDSKDSKGIHTVALPKRSLSASPSSLSTFFNLEGAPSELVGFWLVLLVWERTVGLTREDSGVMVDERGFGRGDSGVSVIPAGGFEMLSVGIPSAPVLAMGSLRSPLVQVSLRSSHFTPRARNREQQVPWHEDGARLLQNHAKRL